MRVTLSGRPLRLAPHVRACQIEEQVILLDLQHNRYLGVGNASSKLLAGRVEGWPIQSDPSSEYASASVVVMIQRLAEHGLIANGRRAPTPDSEIDEPTGSLDLDHDAADGDLGACRVGRFVRSAAVTALWMRYRTLHSIAEEVAARRQRLQNSATVSSSLEGMRAATAAYERLRPFVFTAQDRCLHDSLALVTFLAAEGALPRWVIGVKTRPFGAHSWVQFGGIVLNDQHENVRRYSPILVV